MNKVEKTLYKTRKTVQEACDECGVDFEDAVVSELEECSSCSIWLKHYQLKPDLDNNPVCKECLDYYGF